MWLTNARVFDATGAEARDGRAILVEDGLIAAEDRAGAVPDNVPDNVDVIDLAGRTVLPGLIDAHAHVFATPPTPEDGAEPLWPGLTAHFVATGLRKALRMGFTTLRDVGSYGDEVVTARQAMRYGAFSGPRVLTCGKIVSATAPGGRFFDGMYREADGPDEVRKAVREQVRRGADFVKVMSTGARSVELEDPHPAQLTGPEIAALVDEAHRLGYRVAAHAEGLAGTELAIRLGADTIEHGMYLNQRPDLLDKMAATGQVLVPTLSCYYGVASGQWTAPLVRLAQHNLAEASRTLLAARAAGVPIALGHDWQPFSDAAVELTRLVEHGMTTHEALLAATATGAHALGLADRLGTIQPGKIADLVIVDGDPLTDPMVLRDQDRIWLVLQGGDPVAGAVFDNSAAIAANARTATVSRSVTHMSALSNAGMPRRGTTDTSG
nr:amidohydrolase [Kibdelosporangium sp. MJ126-NF4]